MAALSHSILPCRAAFVNHLVRFSTGRVLCTVLFAAVACTGESPLYRCEQKTPVGATIGRPPPLAQSIHIPPSLREVSAKPTEGVLLSAKLPQSPIGDSPLGEGAEKLRSQTGRRGMFFGFAREIVGVQPTKKNSLGTHRVLGRHDPCRIAEEVTSRFREFFAKAVVNRENL